MGAFQQFGLLLKKNALLRKRHPGILLLEVVWPILIVAIIALIRVGVQPIKSEDCHYQERAMPSAGLVPFLQTYVCNLDNKCHNSQEDRQTAQQQAASLSALVSEITPYLADDDTLGALDVIDDSVTLITSFTSLVEDDQVMGELNNATKIAQYFRDPNKIRRMLIQDYGFTPQMAKALLDSEVNITTIMELTGYPDLKAVACDPDQLGMYLKFPEGTNVQEVSDTLCEINDSRISEITNVLQSQLDVAQIVRLLGLFESLKDRLNIRDTWEVWLRNVADMLDLLFSVGNLQDLVRELIDFKGLPDIIRRIPDWIHVLQKTESATQPLKGLVDSLDPLMNEFFPNDTIWTVIRDGMALAPQVADLLDGRGNVTSTQFMEDLTQFLQDIENIFNDLSPEVRQMLDEISSMKWSHIFGLVGSLFNETADTPLEERLNQLLIPLQSMLDQLPYWADISRYTATGTEFMRALNSLLTAYLDAQSSVLTPEARGELERMLDSLMSKGPDVTLAILKSFTHADTLAVLLTEQPEFSRLCSDIVADVAGKVGQTTSNDLNATLCYGSMRAFQDIFDQLGVTDISNAVNQTIYTIMDVVTGKVIYTSGNFTAFATQFSHLSMTFGRLFNMTDMTWGNLFSLRDMLEELALKHEYDWEPVLDLLNENYLGSGVLGLMRAMENVMDNPGMNETLGPIVHVASVSVRNVYNEMKRMEEMFSKDSPMVQLVTYATTYAPELMQAVMDMGSNGKMDMVYALASSRDPMKTLCDSHVVQNLGMPSYVPAAELEETLCTTNWTEVFIQLESMQSVMDVMIKEIVSAMSDLNNPNVTYSFKQDVQQLMDYSNELVAMMMADGDMTTMLMGGGPWSVFIYANFTQLGAAVDVVMSSAQNLGMDFFDRLAEIVFRVFENLDGQMRDGLIDGGFLQFLAIKQDIMFYDFGIRLLNVSMSSGMALSDVLTGYPPEISDMVELAAGAYLEFIDVLKRVILKPDQLVHKFVTGSIEAPTCGGTTLTSILDLAADSYFGRLESEVCAANWTAILLSMSSQSQNQPQNQQIQEISDGILNVIEHVLTQTDIEVNWMQILDHTRWLLNFMEQPPNMTWPSTFDLSPFNMTAINMKWAQFVRDMDQLQQMDTESLIKVAGDLQNLFMNMGGDVNNTFLDMLQAQAYMQQEVMIFLVKQLCYINSTTEVNILDMLGSNELRKVAEVLRYSPEINTIGVRTLIRLTTDYSTTGMARVITEPDQFMSLCSNLTLFSWVVAVDDSIIDTAELQRIVCSLNINFTALLGELEQNWDGFAELIDSFSKLMEPGASLSVDYAQAAEMSVEYSQLLASIMTHPPTFTLFSDDEHWMNGTLYESEWNNLARSMENIFNQYMDPQDAYTGAIMGMLAGLAGVKEARPVFYAMDASLDLMQHFLEEMEEGPRSFENFPNLQRMYQLLEQFPELFEMVAYTSVEHPKQVEAWGPAMTSWETFCSTDPTTLMTAPPGSSLNVNEVFGRLCAINVTELMTELSSYRGFKRLQMVIEGGNITEPVDLAALEGKVTSFISLFENMTSSSPGMGLDLRILNMSVWEHVFERLGPTLNNTAQVYMTPVGFYNMLLNLTSMFPELGGLQGAMEQALALTDVILDQVLRSVEGGTLEEMFNNYPTVQSVIKLMDSLPEIADTLAYTGLMTPEKISSNPEAFTSFESFCGADLSAVFSVPPEVNFDLAAWQAQLCAINLTVVMEELADYQGTTEIEKILQPSSTYSFNLTAISLKVQKVVERLTSLQWSDTDMTLGARFLNASAWEGVAAHLESWAQSASAMWGTTEGYQRLITANLLASLEGIPELQMPLQYTSAILDMFESQLKNSLKSLPEAFGEYPNMKTLLSLLEDVPEIFEMFGYTTLQHPEQLARWSSAMTSWDTFCSTDPTTLMTAPPGNPLDVTEVFGRLCSMNITQLMIELNSYQGQDRLNALIMGENVTEPVNVTAMAERITDLIKSMETLFTGPMDTGYNLRLFNVSVWERVLERLGSQLNETQERIMSPEFIVDMYQMLFAGMNETKDMVDRAVAVADVVVDQMLRSLQGGSVQELFDKYPTAQKAFRLLDSLPEIFETLVYSWMFAPEKISSNADAFASLETFCTTDMRTVFTVPAEVDFNITVWQYGFCTLNITVLMEELSEYMGTQDIANIFNQNTTVQVDLTSVISKIETVVRKMNEIAVGNSSLFTWEDRFLNMTLWENALAKLEKWAGNTSLDWMAPERYLLWLGSPELVDQLGFMTPWLATSVVIMEKMLQYENKTSFSLEELFMGAPELQKLVQLMEEPGAIEVLFQSLNSPQFEPVLVTNNMTASFAMLCDPSTPLSQFLIIPEGVSIDLVGVKSRLCALNPQLIEQQFMDFLDIDRLTAAMNGSIPVDLRDYIRLQNRVSAMITRWTESPPTFTLPEDWNNETFWLGMLERYAMQRQDPKQIMTEVESFMQKLSSMPGDPLHQVGLVMQTVMRLINKNIVALQNQSLTLDNMFERIPVLQDVMNALGIEGEMMDALKKSPMKNSQLLVEALLSSGTSAYQALCNSSQIGKMVELPPAFNTTALYEAVCLKDFTTVVDNLVRNLDIQGLIDGLQSQSAVANWSVVFQQSEELQRNIENLIKNPPSFNASALLAMLESQFNTSDMWQLTSSFSSLWDSLRQIPGFEFVESYLKASAVVTELLDNLVNRLMIDGVTLDLASLFSKSPSFVRLMDALLQAQPDPFTAWSTIQLRPSMSAAFSALASDPAALQAVMCSETEFRKYFNIPEVVNMTQVRNVVCTMNFTQFVEELGENFMVDALTRKFADVENASVPFDLQSYVATYLNLVEHINTLTGVRNVTFNHNRLDQAFSFNETLILDAFASMASSFEEQYMDILTAVLDPLLIAMGNSTTEGQTVVLIFKILETYLHSLNQELGALMEGPISLSAIMNNTEAGRIAIPFLQDPDKLDELLNLQLLPEQLNALFMEPDVLDALCGPKLFTAFSYPSNESAVLRQLQSSVCSTNLTVMMWQAIMGQANGYQLYLQFGRLSEEVATGKVSVNNTAISGEINQLVAMVMKIVSEYENGTRSLQDLLDWEGFQEVYTRFQSSLTDRLMNLTQWSSTLMSSLDNLPDFEGKDFMVRTINTANIFMEIINDRLRDVIANNVSLSSLLGHSQTLFDLMDAYLDVTQLSVQAWIDGQFSMERVIQVFANSTMMDEMCKAKTLAAYLADSPTVPEIATTMQTVMCSLTTTLPQAFRGFIDYTAIQEELEMIWNMSVPVQPQFQRYQENVQAFSDLVLKIAQMGQGSLGVDPGLANRFNFNSMLDSLMSITEHPEMIFRLMKAFGIVMDGPLSTNDNQNMFYGINAYVAQPILMVTERLNRMGLTMSSVMNDPSKLLEALPVLLDFSTQFEVLAVSYLQPTINIIWNNKEFRDNHMCNGNLPADVLTSTGLDANIMDTLCQTPTTQWIEELQKHGATAMQIYSFVAKLQEAYRILPECHPHTSPSGAYTYVCEPKNSDMMDEGSRNWMRLMTSLESLAKHLTPDEGQGTAQNMTDSLSRLWDIMGNAFLDKFLHSAMNYMEMQDRTMGDAAGEWLTFKQFVKFLDSAGKFLSTYLHGKTDERGMISLQSMLPDSDRVAALMQDIFGQASAAEVLASSVNPELFYELSFSDRLEGVACDAARFNNMFTFEPGVNVAAIQQSLCDAVRNRSTSLQELIDLFHAGDMLTQLDRMLSGNYTSMNGDFGIWEALYRTVRGLITDLEQIQQGNFNATVSMSWFQPILDRLMGLNQNTPASVEASCRSYTSFISGTAWYSESEGMLIMATRVMELAKSAVPFIPLMDDMACAMVTPDGLDLAAGINLLKQHGLNDFFRQVSALMTNGTEGEFQCHDLVQSSNEFYQLLNATIMSPDLDMMRMGQCMERGSALFADLMEGINQIYRVMADMMRLLDEEDFSRLISNSGELGEMLRYILSIFTHAQSVTLKFEDLLVNSTSVEDYLQGILKLAPEAVDAFLRASVNLNSSAFLNHTVSEIADTLCDPAALDEVVDLPPFSPVDIVQLSDFLCQGDVNLTAAVFKDARQSFDYVSRLMGLLSSESTDVYISNLTANLVVFFEQLQAVSPLINMFGDGIDIEYLRRNADAIDRLLVGGSIQRIIGSMEAIVGDLWFIVPEDSRYIITDIQTFIRGLMGLDFIQARLLEAIQVSDLIKAQDVVALKRYLINGLGFSPEMTDALLNSYYSIRVFLNASDIILSDEPCSQKLQQFLILNGTAAMNRQIVDQFCGLNETMSLKLFQDLLPELSIGGLVQRYITYSGEQFLQSINMTQTEVKDIVEKLGKGSTALNKAAHVIGKKNGTRDPILDDIFAISGEFDAVVSLEPVLCGRQSSVEDQFNLNSKIGGSSSSGGFEFTSGSESDGASSGASGSGGGMSGQGSAGTTQSPSATQSPQTTVHTVYAPPEDFCRQMYRRIRNSEMGAVIWAYLKPIMSGKILFTPDNAVTRQIIQEANWVFDTIREVKRVAGAWATKAPSLAILKTKAGEMEQVRDVLSNTFVQRILETTVGVDSDSLMSGLEALNNQEFNSSEIDSLQKVAEVVYNYSRCVGLDRFEAVATEAELESRAWELFKTKDFFAGVVFTMDTPDSGSRKKRQADPGVPTHIKYKIRMDMDNVPSTHRLKERLWMPYPEDNFAQDLRYFRGFLQLQDMIENAIIKLQTQDSAFNTTMSVSMQQMPFPCYTEDDYLHYLGAFLLPVVMTFAWLAAIGIATFNLVYDRQNGQEEQLRVMGMTTCLNTFAWMVFTLFLMAIVAVACTLIIKFGGVFTNSNWIILFLYILAFCFSTTMLCYFISAFFTRVTLAILSVLIIYFITYLPYVVLISAELEMTFWQKTLACLSSTTAFSFGAVFITRFEEETTGIQWSNVDEKLADPVSFSWTVYMMLIDAGIYLILGWYVRNVKPGKYGKPQPWYFPFSPSYWCGGCSDSTHALPKPSTAQKDADLFEAAPEGLDVGISVRGLRKQYKGQDTVVHSLDMDVFHDQITSLLGHNGAAKTTTLNMLTGVLSPNAGVVLIEGKKATGKTGLLGLCPQHNALFEYMTVMEHMVFYSGIKGNMSFVESQREIRKLLHDVDLYHMKDVPARHLSGGMQRRLCVALAFVGGSRTVVLDEPTSGIDPHARKNIWNLIIRNRPGRTILMSTHHLDEADMVSDRILVMHKGRLLCVGSPAFLKKQLGGGYRLTINTYPAEDTVDETEEESAKAALVTSSEVSARHSRILEFIRSCIPGAAFVESVGMDLTIRLPQDGSDSATMGQFFRTLDTRAAELGILGYGVSNTTLEEVFLKVTTDADNGMPTNGSSSGSSVDTESTTDSERTVSKAPLERPKRKVTGVMLKLQQLGALLVKHVHHYRRNWRMMISTIVLPLLAFLCALGFAELRPTTDDMPSLLMTPALYAPNTYAFFQDNSNTDMGRNFSATLYSPDPGVGTTCMDGFNAGKKFKCVAPNSWYPSEKMEQVCRCNDNKYECEDGVLAESVQNIRSRPHVILQDLNGKDLNVYLINSYSEYIDQRFGGWSLETPQQEGNTTKSTAKVWFNNKGHHSVPSYFNAFSNNLLRTAVGPSSSPDFGITLYNHPLMLNKEQLSSESIEAAATDMGIAMVILLALSFITSAFIVYQINERLSHERHMQAISGVGSILYWIASFIWDLFIYAIVMALMVAIVCIFKTGGYYDRQNLEAFALLVFLYGWAILPAMYCTLRLFKSGSSAYMTLFCINMFLGLFTSIILFVFDLLQDLKNVYEAFHWIFHVFPQFCLSMGLVNLVSNQVQYELLARFGEDTYVSPFDEKMLYWKYVALAVQGGVFFIAAIFIHSRKSRAISMSSSMNCADKEDEDVFREHERVKTASNGDILVLRDLSKVYSRGMKKFCAVNRISFGVGRGECFGLLGVNGAGKTTSFKMLTGATTPSLGTAIICGKKLDGLSLCEEVGYCPQEDALDMYLSGRETLYFHAKLRGFDSEQAKQVVEEQLKRLHLLEHADRAVHTYSGGTKRKLNLAIAMLGDPAVLLLDEPTTGMDASTRRLAWKCITSATQQGQAVILTSHSMDECDALCSRIAIMVNGQMKCLGSPQHLKNKFGDGYTVMMHLQGLSSNRFSIAEAFLTQFPGSVIKVSERLKDQHHSILEVSIPRGSGAVADIFSALSRAQAENQIMYYSVSQTTLDTIFVNFAQEQTDDGEAEFDAGSSSGSSSGSLSGKDSHLQKSLTGGTYAYMNPEYSSSEMLKGTQSGQLMEPPFAAFENPAYSDELVATRL